MPAAAGLPETRDAILHAAEGRFGRLGYSATSMSGIAEDAQVSRPLIYRYFRDKDSLYRTVVTRVLTEWNDALVEVAARSVPTTAHTIDALVESCIEWAGSRTMLRGVLLRDHDVVRRVALQEIEEGRDLLPALIERVLVSGVARGDVRSDLEPAVMAEVLTQAITAASLQVMTVGPDEGTARRTRAMAEVLLHGVVITPGLS